jgi:type IV pilus assembly protein PilB
LSSNDEYVLEILQNAGLIDATVSAKAREISARDGSSAIEVLIESDMVDQVSIMKTLATQFGMEYFPSLKGVDIDQEVVDMVPGETAQDFKVMPVYQVDGVLTVAMADPMDLDTIDSLHHILNREVKGAIADPKDIETCIATYYARSTRLETMMQEVTQSAIDVEISEETQAVFADDGASTEEDAPIIRLVSLLIIQAFRMRSSDIHIEPMDGYLRVRYRIDGVLHQMESPPRKLQSAIVQRIKLMAEMKIDEKNVPQDGRIQINVMGRDLDLRVSTVPSVHGESVVMRILDKENLSMGLPQLGFLSDDKAAFDKLIRLADGIILVTGPTGSGKTTSLYACLNEINTPDRKIITVEDPVEYQMSGINQVAVRADIGLTFSNALRSILRQAPNIIMIGEIRDMETAEIAVNASLTGHLVFSTLHTNDAPSAVTRLSDIGVKPFLVASSVRAIMAQRLVRNICEKCREPYAASTQDLRLLGANGEQLREAQLFKGSGCEMCQNTGYRGRKGIFEIFLINEEVQHMIYDQVTSTELRIKARELGMRTLREDGLRKVIAGITTLDEVFRVTMGED